jgi:hypothetical protein
MLLLLRQSGRFTFIGYSLDTNSDRPGKSLISLARRRGRADHRLN